MDWGWIEPTEGLGAGDELLPQLTNAVVAPLLRPARLGARAEPLLQGTLLAAAATTAPVAAAIAAAAVALFFEGIAAFLFETDDI